MRPRFLDLGFFGRSGSRCARRCFDPGRAGFDRRHIALEQQDAGQDDGRQHGQPDERLEQFPAEGKALFFLCGGFFGSHGEWIKKASNASPWRIDALKNLSQSDRKTDPLPETSTFSRGYAGGLMIIEIEIAVEIGIETDNGFSISTPIV
jgi:hypothetical protein